MMNRFLQNSARGLLRSNLASTSSRRAMVAPLSVGALRSYMILPSVERIGEWTKNEVVKDWLVERIQLHQPDRIHLCDGSEEENELLIKKMVHSGMLIQVNPEKRPNSYLARSPTSDVARVEERTYICSESSDDAGATNNWRDPEETSEMMNDLFKGSMVGRTMYVVPFSMGPIGSPFSITGIQVTDSPYVVASMRIMTRTGDEVMKNLGDSTDFVPCVHSVGAPLKAGEEDTPWPSNPENKYIVHFPEQRRIWSYGSGYGGNALLGKKCLALRIASAMAREEGWLAEHMLIVGITSPEGVKKYVAAAFPSACGKTNLAMMESKLPGWKIECVGDDIAWMRVGKDGQLYAVNPENGFFGVAPGTSYKSNPNAMRMLESNTMFTNVAMTEDGDVWWEDIDGDAPSSLTSWKRTEWSTGMSDKAAHPNARFTVPLESCPVLDSEWNNPEGVPISAIMFGGRRSNTVPLVYQARDWKHGTFVGASMNSETTAAAAGKRGVLRSDPFAMKPFCGYNMADYFKHWLSMTKRTDESKLPKIFHVNWFRKNKAGKFVWPGFGDNIRVIKWIFDRCDKDVSDATNAQESPIGYIPKDGDLDVSGLNISEEDMKLLFRVDPVEWSNEVNRISQTMQSLGPKLPAEIRAELEALESRIKKSAK